MFGDDFYEFRKWSSIIMEGKYIGIRKLNANAPDAVRMKAKEMDDDHFRRTGRHRIIVDDAEE